jgi:hypothetical protein
MVKYSKKSPNSKTSPMAVFMFFSASADGTPEEQALYGIDDTPTCPQFAVGEPEPSAEADG